MGSYRYEILRETTTDSLIMENNTREKKMNSNVYGIDLGTCNMKIYCKTSNKILNEKNTIALVKKDQIYAYGDAAYAMYEKAPETINVTFPVISGVIADFNNLQTMLQMYLEEHMKGKIRGAEFIVAVPTDITDVEKRAFFEMFYKSKLKPKSVLLCEKPIADAVGLGLDVNEPTGIMVVDIGAHTDSPSQYRTVKYIISHRIHLFCPKVLGNRYTESGTASHTESKNQKLYTAACSHTCQCFRPKNLSYDRRIYNIIRLLQ